MALVSAPKILAQKPICIFHPKKIPAKVTATRLEDKVPVQVENLWYLNPMLAKVTGVTVAAALATIRTTGHQMVLAMSGTHKAHVQTASCSSTISRRGRLSVCVTQGLALSSGTRLTSATGFTPRGRVLTMLGSSLLETCLKCTVSVGRVTTLPLRSMFVRGHSCWRCRVTCLS